MKKNKLYIIDTNIGQEDIKPFEIEYEYDIPLNGKVTESTLIFAQNESDAWSMAIMYAKFMEALIHWIRPVPQED